MKSLGPLDVTNKNQNKTENKNFRHRERFIYTNRMCIFILIVQVYYAATGMREWQVNVDQMAWQDEATRAVLSRLFASGRKVQSNDGGRRFDDDNEGGADVSFKQSDVMRMTA